MSALIHVHAPAATEVKVLVRRCPTCAGRRRMLCEHYEWYGWNVTCLGCGEAWSDGERLERPFERGWRRRRIAAARKRLARRREIAADIPAPA